MHQLLRATCDLRRILPLNENTSKTMRQCSALPATFNSYYHQMRKPRDHAPLLRAACDLQLLQPFNVKTLENEPLLRAACDLQLLLPSNENTSKPMNHCSRAACDLQLLMTSDETTSKTMAPLLRAACDLQLLLPFNLKNLENEPLLRVACDPQLLLPSNDKKTSKTMNHCSALPATFNCYFHQTIKPRKPCTTAQRCLRPSTATAIK